MRHICIALVMGMFCQWTDAQTVSTPSNETANDSIRKALFIQNLGNGYLPTKYFNFDLRHLVKYNQYEGFRTGIGGVTSKNFSKNFRLEGYVVYGFLDDDVKYSFGGGVRIFKSTQTWFNLLYRDDLRETGSSSFITDKRFFQFFEPRLINIELFHREVSRSATIEHHISPKMLAELQWVKSDIYPTYTYTYTTAEGRELSTFNLTTATLAIQWSPFSRYEVSPYGVEEIKRGFPQFAIQYTKAFNTLLNGDLGFSKFDFRIRQEFTYRNTSTTEIEFKGGFADGDLPLTHAYHTNPNNVSKETILQRFSVAGISSFETMFFNEFFVDTYGAIQIKHHFPKWDVTPWFQPQFTLISRHAIGDMRDIERHEGIAFSTLEKGYSEIGFEANRLFYGFGLSFAYRYGAYHLPRFEDNFSFKFTFNLDLGN